MYISLKEPVSPRYIYINPVSNRVHLLVPIVGGQEISTDNTCQSVSALKMFFEGDALRVLKTYQSVLEFDLQFLNKGELRIQKKQRLNQINEYINALNSKQWHYIETLDKLKQTPSNLYSIQLRPRDQDFHSKVINPIFSINRKNDDSGTPLSQLFITMYEAYPNATIADISPRGRLNQAVLVDLPEQPVNFKNIQQALTQKCLSMFGENIDFTKDSAGNPIIQADLDELMGFTDDPATNQNYIEVLLNSCASNLWTKIPAVKVSPFYNLRIHPEKLDKADELSILTQFFMAQANIYCKVSNISERNFGEVLDESTDLSQEIVSIICSGISIGTAIEESLCTFINKHAESFGLRTLLTQAHITSIIEQFNRTYNTVTATRENPYMDEFMVLDLSALTGKFVTHQGFICTDLTEFLPEELDNPYFQAVRAEFAKPRTREIPGTNEHIGLNSSFDKKMLSRIEDLKFYALPLQLRVIFTKNLEFHSYRFLHDVAKGKLILAKTLLTATANETQTLLLTPGVFTDYSGRTFNCTGYEYAYWANDTYMCRMLEGYMDEETKAQLLACIDSIETQGLPYIQNNTDYRSVYFDLTPLRAALQAYIDGFKVWYAQKNEAAMKAAWMLVGNEQRNVPAHVAHEYCRPMRPFHPTPQFNETTLPRELTIYNRTVGNAPNCTDFWFPLNNTDAVLGQNIAMMRGTNTVCAGVDGCVGVGVYGTGKQSAVYAQYDLDALTRLDEIRKSDRKISHQYLSSPTSSPGPCWVKAQWHYLKRPRSELNEINYMI